MYWDRIIDDSRCCQMKRGKENIGFMTKLSWPEIRTEQNRTEESKEIRIGQFSVVRCHGRFKHSAVRCSASVPTPDVVTVSSSKKDTVLHEQFILTSICHVLRRPHTMCTYPPAPVRTVKTQNVW